jgi:glutathione S-transferase
MSLVLHAETLWISPYVFSSFVALREKGLPFEVKEVALVDRAHQADGYRALSITGRVPTLEHDGFSVSESSAIAEYLEEAFPPPRYPRLFPEGRTDRARARQLMAWLRSDLGPLREERPTVSMFYDRAEHPMSVACREAVDRLIGAAEALIPPSGGSLFGAWTLVDSELALMLQRLGLNGDPLPTRVREFAQREWTRPSVREFVEHRRPATVPAGYWSIPGNVRPPVPAKR